MKISISFFFILSCLLVTAQINKIVDKGKPSPPAYFIDSIRVNFKLNYIDANDVKSIEIKNGYDSTALSNGSVYITMKKPHHVFLSLKEIADKKINLGDNNQLLFLIDANIITDTSNIKLDSGIISNVQIIYTSDVKYWKQTQQIFTIIKIETVLPKKQKSTEPWLKLQ
jgi:hypothetical protein